MDKSQFFYCYDYFMMQHLSRDNHKYITHARSIRSGREFWLFVKSDALQSSIDSFVTQKNHAKKGIV